MFPRAMTARLAAVILAIAAAILPAVAQVPAPRVYDAAITAASSQVAPSNPTRFAIQFCNPSKSVYVAICPVTSGRTGVALTCTFGGAGSIQLPPGFCRSFQAPDRSAKLPTAWNGLTESGSSGLTIIEME